MKKEIRSTCDPDIYHGLSALDKTRHILRAHVKPSNFWNDPVLGNLQLWPKQAEIIDAFNELDPTTKKRKYNQLWIAAGRGASKTTLLSLIGIYEFFKLNSMESPQRKYKLIPNQEIQIVNAAPKEKQAEDTIFAKLIELMQDSPYMMSQDFEYIGTKIKFKEKNLAFQYFGSNSSTALGRTVKAFLADEVSHFTDKEGRRSAKEVWDELSASTQRFRSFGEDVSCAISNPRYYGDFITSEIQKLREFKVEGVLIYDKLAVWHLDPKVTYEDFRNLEVKDPEAFRRLYMADPGDETEKFFPKTIMDKIKPFMRDDNWFDEQGVIKDVSRIRHDPGALGYLVAADPSQKIDSFGLGVGHFYRDFTIKIDGITSVKKNENEKYIDVSPIKRILDVLFQRLSAKAYLFDVYLHPELLEISRKHLVEPFFHQVDRTDYNFLKDDLITQRTSMPFFEQTIEEMDGLVDIKQRKVDHENGSSKDSIDCVCQIVSYVRRWEESDYMTRRKHERKAKQSNAGRIGLFLPKFI